MKAKSTPRERLLGKTLLEVTATDLHPAVRPGMGVTLFVSDCPEPVFGVIVDVYTDVLGGEAAEIHLPCGETTHQCVRFLTVVRPAVSS